MTQQRRLPRLLGNALAAHLPRQVALDGGDARLDPVGRHVVELDFKAGQRAHMGNTAAHLPCADHPNLANIERHGF